MKKITLTVALLLGVFATAFAQDPEPNASRKDDVFHITLGLAGGINGFTVDNGLDGALKVGPNAGFEFGFYCFPTEHVGIRTGVNAVYAASAYNYDKINGTLAYREAPYTIDYNYVANDAKLDVSTIALQVPLQLALKSTHWYANLGFKMMIPIDFKAKTSLDVTDVKATIRETGTLLDPESTDPFSSSMARLFGCGKYNGSASKKTMNLAENWTILAAVDFGYRFASTSSTTWTIGVYADYSLTKLKPQNDFINVRAASGRQKKVTVKGIPISHLGYFDAGIKIQCDFGLKVK